MPAISIRNFLYLFFALIYLATSCRSPIENSKAEVQQHGVNDKAVKYAKGFRFSTDTNILLLEVFSPWKRAEDTMKYCLYGRDDGIPRKYNDMIMVKTPVKSIVCLSTTHLGYIDMLGQNQSITGIAGTKWVNNREIASRIDSGYIKDVGIDNHLNYELILEMEPDVVFAYGIEGHSLTFMHKLNEFGIPTVIVSEYMETDPLRKAEWIKFIAAFFEIDSVAEERFNEIENNYIAVKEQLAGLSNRPTVFTGLPWKGDWFVPGGKSFQARLLEDAGAEYLWADNPERSGMIVDIEVVFEKAVNADFWINVNDYHRMDEVLSLDHRYENFNAVKNGQVYNNNYRQNKQLGNDYWESGVVKPDVILKDLAKMFHPETMQAHDFFFYQQLN